MVKEILPHSSSSVAARVIASIPPKSMLDSRKIP
nr:MAG TPA: hypothetical protein [Caudoviricetes sp.]